MPRSFRLLTLLLVAILGLTVVQPISAHAGAPSPVSSAEDVAQAGGASQARPGPIVRQAFDLLLDYYVIPPKSGDVLNGGLDAAHHFLERNSVADPLAERPPFTGERRGDWQLFLEAYGALARALGDKAPRGELDQAIVDGMAASLNEQHTTFLPPEVFSRQMADLENRNQFGGIGISMNRELTVMDVFEGSPAEAAGIRPGDQLVAVDGVPVEGQDLTETSTRIRGEVGTTVTLTWKRPGEAAPVVKTVTRATITYEWLRARILDGGIGYLQIRTFALAEALPLFNRAMEQFEQANVRALIIDVRNNTGGSVQTGQEILSRLLPDDRPLYREVDRRGGERTVKTWGEYWGRDIPIAVLTNGNSASMSEILAAALQENGAARVIGTKTAGAVAAAVPFPLADGSGLMVTVQLITTPTGQVLNEVGLEPDQVVEFDLEQFRHGKDNQLEAALSYVREQADQRAAPGRRAA